MGNHSTDSLEEDLGRSAEMVETTGLVESGSLAQVGMVLELVAEKLSTDVEGFTTDDDNGLTVEELLGNCRGQATKKMALSVNHNSRLSGHDVTTCWKLESEVVYALDWSSVRGEGIIFISV